MLNTAFRMMQQPASGFLVGAYLSQDQSESNASKISSQASRVCRPMTCFPFASACHVGKAIDALSRSVELKGKAVSRWQASHTMKTKLLGYLLQIQPPACCTNSTFFCASRMKSYIICVGRSVLPRNAIFLRCLQNNGSYMQPG